MPIQPSDPNSSPFIQAAERLQLVFLDYLQAFGKQAIWHKRTGEASKGLSRIGAALGDADHLAEGWVRWLRDPSVYTMQGSIRVVLELPQQLTIVTAQALVGGQEFAYTEEANLVDLEDVLEFDEGRIRFMRVKQVNVRPHIYRELSCEVAH